LDRDPAAAKCETPAREPVFIEKDRWQQAIRLVRLKADAHG
jgi:hypothetical protein